MPTKTGAKIIAGLVFFVMLSSMALGFALNQPGFWADISLRLLKRYSPALVVFKEVDIQGIHWSSWQKLTLENVRVRCELDRVSYSFSTGQVAVDNLGALVGLGALSVNIKDLAVVSGVLNISDVQGLVKLYFNRFHYRYSAGHLAGRQIEFSQYLVRDFQGDFEDNGHRIKFSNAQGRFYGGDIVLKGLVKYFQHLSYDIHIQLDHVDSSLMARANPAFAQLTAVVEGTIQVEDFTSRGLSIQANLQAPLGGRIKASLLRYLAQYVPQRGQIEDLIHQDANVMLDKIQVKVTSLNQEKLSSDIILNSSSLNLNVNMKFDIHVEGGLDHLLEYMRQ